MYLVPLFLSDLHPMFLPLRSSVPDFMTDCPDLIHFTPSTGGYRADVGFRCLLVSLPVPVCVRLGQEVTLGVVVLEPRLKIPLCL